jgi:hypothetical protein
MKIQQLLFGCLLLVSCSKETLPPEIQKSLTQTTNYIEQFKLMHSTLPTRDEYMVWWNTNNLRGVDDYQITNSGRSSEYFLHIWLGERAVIYSSKDKTISAPRN